MFLTEGKKYVKQGKVKEIWDDGSYLYFRFTDNISVFDKIIPTKIPSKGESLCLTGYHWFDLLNKNGIKNHLIELIDNNVMKVKKLDVITDYSKITEDRGNYLIPLEFIVRYYAAGSLMDRIKNGTITVDKLGFESGYNVKYGDKLPQPFFEVTTKLEHVDRTLIVKEAKKISGLSEKDLDRIKDIIMKIDRLMDAHTSKNGLIHVDGKKEFGMDENREPIVIDTFGTADEDRYWDSLEYNKGNFIELSKEFVRQYYRNIGYHSKLMEARANHSVEPEIPPLPEKIVREVSDLYIRMYERLTNRKFPK